MPMALKRGDMPGNLRVVAPAVLHVSDVAPARLEPMYAERPSALPSTVVWRAARSTTPRVVPDGCTDLIWTGEGLLVAGPDTRAHVGPVVGSVLTALRFGPGVGPAVFGMGVDELRDQRIDFADLGADGDARRCIDRLLATRSPVAALEAIVAERMGQPSPMMLGVAAMLEEGRSVQAAAEEAGLSARQLQRRSVEAFGYGPKLLGRILRFQRALRLARGRAPFAAVAAHAGYSDQAHLARDVKDLAGVTLGELVHG